MIKFTRKVTENYEEYRRERKTTSLLRCIQVFSNYRSSIEEKIATMPLHELIDINDTLLLTAEAVEHLVEINHFRLKNLKTMKSIFKLVINGIKEAPSSGINSKLADQMLIAQYKLNKSTFLILEIELCKVTDKSDVLPISAGINHFSQLLARQYKDATLQTKLGINDELIQRVNEAKSKACLLLSQSDNTVSLAPQVSHVEPINLGVKRIRNTDRERSFNTLSFFTQPVMPPIKTLPEEKIRCVVTAFEQLIPEENINLNFLSILSGIMGNFFHYSKLPHSFSQCLNLVVASELYQIGLYYNPNNTTLNAYNNDIKNTVHKMRLPVAITFQPKPLNPKQNFLNATEDVFTEIDALFASKPDAFLKTMNSMVDYFVSMIKDANLLGRNSEQLMNTFLETSNNVTPAIDYVSYQHP